MAISNTFQNPIIPGFNPDPSCIRVNETFYLITSTFQFFPGLPIYRSNDLVNWEIIGQHSLFS
jgi:xylan 1,4-beta-xylosidase